MDACPACSGSLLRKGSTHCTSPTCSWIHCGTCNVNIDADTGNYWDGPHLIWGNEDGYLKATG
jgi:ferredoxin-like protein FixX